MASPHRPQASQAAHRRVVPTRPPVVTVPAPRPCASQLRASSPRQPCPACVPAALRAPGRRRVTQQVAEGEHIPAELALGQVGPLAPRERQRPPRGRVLRKARHDMGVQVRHGVPEDLVVQLDRLIVPLQRRPHPQDLTPIAGGLLLAELGRLGDVPSPPDDHRVPPLPGNPLQVGVTETPGQDADTMLVLPRPAPLAHRAPSPPPPLRPLRGPGHTHPTPPVAAPYLSTPLERRRGRVQPPGASLRAPPSLRVYPDATRDLAKLSESFPPGLTIRRKVIFVTISLYEQGGTYVRLELGPASVTDRQYDCD